MSRFFKNKFIYFIYLFLAELGLLLGTDFSLVAVNGGYSSLWRAGFSLRWLFLLQSTGSRRVGFSSCDSRALECRLSSCGAPAQLLRGMWDLPRPGLEPVSPALAGGFLTTAPPGKTAFFFFFSLETPWSSNSQRQVEKSLSTNMSVQFQLVVGRLFGSEHATKTVYS